MIKNNSKKITKGDTFIAIKGIDYDGHDYINEAIINGATKVIVEKGKYNVKTKKVKDTKKYLRKYLKRKYKKMLNNIHLIGVTGTNGKTTTAFLIYQSLNKCNIKCAYIGTIGFYLNEKILDLKNTTPDILDIYEMLIKCKENNYNYVALEVSSQALDMHRLDTLIFDYAIFTNLTRDHLDYHKTMDSYCKAKQRLFKQLKGISIINMDDPYKDYFITKKTITFGENNSNYQINNYTLLNDETIFTLNNEVYKTKLIGKYNIYNIIPAIIILKELKQDTSVIEDVISPVGRMDKIKYKDNTIIIDYAHTNDALEKILLNIRELKINKIYTIIGCGGNRDKTKRPLMGNIATNLSDYVIFTNDNPRYENPDDILDDITKNITKKNYKIIKNRCKAIKKGIHLLKKNDILLLLGKGHENYQIIKDKKIYFSDIQVVKEIIGR